MPMKIPAQYLPVMPYLIVSDSRAFYEFAQKVFGATEQLIAPAEDGNIMHGEIRIGDAVIMFAQATDAWQEKTGAMFLYVDSVDEMYEKALIEGAKPLEAPSQKEYGYTASIEDPWENYWFIVAGEKEQNKVD